MKNGFKVDDEVICIDINNSGAISPLKLGKIYIVKETGAFFVNLVGIKLDYLNRRFIKYSDRNKLENEKIMLELIKKRLLGDT